MTSLAVSDHQAETATPAKVIQYALCEYAPVSGLTFCAVPVLPENW